MRIALGVRRFRLGGGQEQFAVRLAQHLVGSGHAVAVYTFDGEPIPGVQLQRIPLPRFRLRHRRDWATGKQLAKALSQSQADVTYGEQKTWHADVVRAGGGSEVAYWEYALQRKWKHAPGWLAYAYPKRVYDIRAEQMSILAPSTKTVIVNSHLVAQAMHDAYPQIDHKIRVIHNGAILATPGQEQRGAMRSRLRSSLGIPESAPVMLFIGHDFYRKGLDAAIQVLTHLHKPPVSQHWHLLVAGRGDRLPYLIRSRRAGVQAYTHFVDRDTDCACMYAAADVLVLPTYYDPFANVTVEALAAGIPVLTTRLNGGSEIIIQNHNGWITESPADLAPMVEALAWVGRCPHLLQQYKQQAARSAQRHRMASRLQEIETILLEAAGRRLVQAAPSRHPRPSQRAASFPPAAAAL